MNNLSRQNFSYYLAGLIEGDGSIIVPKISRSEKGKLQYAKFKITFAYKDLPLVNKLISVLEGGYIEFLPKNSNSPSYLNLIIQDKNTFFKVVNLINGKMRTPKIEALHRAITFLNDRDNINIPLLGLDTLSSNNWLAGFIESDGCFYINYSEDSNNICKDIHHYMAISQRKTYHRDSFVGESYYPIMETIGEFLEVSVTPYSRQRISKIEEGLLIRTASLRSSTLIDNYLKTCPLFSSKYLDYLDWSRAHYIITQKLYKNFEGSSELKTIKASINTKRKKFNWDHLNNFYS